MKKKLLIVALSLMLVLTACSSSEPKKEEPKKTEEKVEEKKEETKTEEKKEESTSNNADDSEIGKITKVISKDINIEKNTDELNTKITDVTISTVDPNEKGSELLQTQEKKPTVIAVGYKVENKTDKTLRFYPGQAPLITNTKEQLTPNQLLTEDIGGDFIGKVVKEGYAIYVSKSKPEELKNLKIVIDAPNGEDYNPIGKNVEFNIDLTK